MHSLERTSPKGQDFIGKCTKCGEENLKMEDVAKDCPMDDVVSDESALLSALEGPKRTLN